MRTVARSFVIVAFSFVVTSCAGGDKSTPSNPADYEHAIVSLLSNCALTQSATPADAGQVGALLSDQGTAWRKLKPPAELAAAHNRYGDLIEKAAADFGTAGAVATVRPDSDASKAYTSAASAFATWRDMFEKYYDVRLFQVQGQSMEPSLRSASTFVFKNYDASQAIERWSIIIFQYPLDPSRDFVKRVVGLPGDTIEVRDSKVYVNRSVVEGDTYEKDTPNYTYAAKTVPPDMYWVLGDNRRNSFDSHAWGTSCSPQQLCDFVPTEKILGVLPADTTTCR